MKHHRLEARNLVSDPHRLKVEVVHSALPRGGGLVRRLLTAPRGDEIFAFRRQFLGHEFGNAAA
jgi:hypothetical protein